MDNLKILFDDIENFLNKDSLEIIIEIPKAPVLHACLPLELWNDYIFNQNLVRMCTDNFISRI